MKRNGTKPSVFCAVMIGVGLTLLSVQALALPITGDISNSSGLGHYEGVFEYEDGVLSVVLRNTSPVDNGGLLTGFAFGNPNPALITGVDTYDFELPWTLLGESGSINAMPFGEFAFGASTNGAFQGGNSSGGLTPGDTASFEFRFAGSHLDTLDTLDFLNAASSGPQGSVFFVARFQGFEDGGSDKVPATLDGFSDGSSGGRGGPGAPVVPEPATAGLMILGVGGMLIKRFAVRSR